MRTVFVRCVAACEDREPTAGDAAASVVFCVSDEASYMLGSTFFLDRPRPDRGCGGGGAR